MPLAYKNWPAEILLFSTLGKLKKIYEIVPGCRTWYLGILETEIIQKGVADWSIQKWQACMLNMTKLPFAIY